MNQGSNPPSGSGGKGRRRRHGRRGPVTQQSGGPAQGQQHGQQRHGPPKRHGRKGPRPAGQNQPGGGIYSAPMDHSYRNSQGNNDGNLHKQGRGGRGGPGFGKFLPADPEPVPMSVSTEDQPTRIFAFVD